jgi:DnaJ like chaperone protein
MSIWGKIGIGAAGLLFGGPVGAAVGLVAGHYLIDRAAEADGGDPGIAFTIAVIGLAGKMAKADGVVTEEEIAAFERIFRVPPEEQPTVRRFFDLARQDTAGFEAYAQQIARMYAAQPAVLEDILDGLFEIAAADGVLHPDEESFLERVAEIFGFSPGEFRRIRASHFAPDAADPYVVLGVDFEAGNDEIKRTYYRLVRENHPDSLIARGVPEEFIKIANDKLAAINGAYEKIQQERGIA